MTNNKGKCDTMVYFVPSKWPKSKTMSGNRGTITAFQNLLC